MKIETKRRLRIAFDFVDEKDEKCDGNLSFINTFEVSLNEMPPMQRIQFTSILEEALLKAIDYLTQTEEIDCPIALCASKASAELDNTHDKSPRLAYKVVRYGSKIETRKSSLRDDVLRHVEP